MCYSCADPLVPEALAQLRIIVRKQGLERRRAASFCGAHRFFFSSMTFLRAGMRILSHGLHLSKEDKGFQLVFVEHLFTFLMGAG